MVDSKSELALAAALSLIRLEATVFGRGALRAPWGVQTKGLEHPTCFLVVSGSAHLTTKGSTCTLSAGDVVLIRAGVSLTLRDSAASRAVPFAEFVAGLPTGGKGARTTLVCGSLELDASGQSLFGAALPTVVHFASGEDPTTSAIVQALAAEAAGAGSPPILTRLAELVFLQSVRIAITREKGTSGWLRGLGDPSLSRALAAIHREPARGWTLETLARTAAMSRSSFAERFKRKMGQTPLAYVAAWRMRVAARSLEQGASIKSIARAVGYGSDEAFSRAFRGWAGGPPGQWRRKVTGLAGSP